MSQPPTFDARRAIVIGVVIPVLITIIDGWFLDRELQPPREIVSAQAMACFVLQVGMFGVLCGRLIEPAWFRWVLFGWCLLITDLNAAASFSPQIGLTLCTAQLGLVVMWIVLGTSSWKIRLTVALLVAVPALVSIVQTATLCLICLVLRSQGFRLELADAGSPGEASTPAAGLKSRPIQFGISDVLLWTTALSPLLAFSRLGIREQFVQMTLVTGVLDAVVLVVALWSALGRGPAWVRWPLLLIFGLVGGLIWADFRIYRLPWFPPNPPPWFTSAHFETWLWEWEQIVSFLVAGGMLAATLLIFRVLGYRLCRDRLLSASMSQQPQQP